MLIIFNIKILSTKTKISNYIYFLENFNDKKKNVKVLDQLGDPNSELTQAEIDPTKNDPSPTPNPPAQHITLIYLPKHKFFLCIV